MCIGFLFGACTGNNNSSNSTEKHEQDIRKPLMDINKRFVEEESRRIDDLVQRYGWPVTKTGTGLRYVIYRKTNGKKAQMGDIARIKYSVKLLTGDVCYTSDNEGVKEIRLGNDTNEPGLHEGILLMRAGEHAKIILPSHLAFGISGDGQCIPPRAALIYEVELMELLNPNTDL